MLESPLSRAHLTLPVDRGYLRSMTEEMKARIDEVLDGIQDTDSGLTVAQMGLVERVRYSPEGNLMTVFTRAMHHTRG